jgi:hypothetical protein
VQNSTYASVDGFPAESTLEVPMYMNWMIRIVMMATLSAVIALGLSLLPKAESAVNPTIAVDWMGKRQAQLTEKNVVDFIVSLPLQLRIRKVELTHSILSIDLNLPKNVDEAAVYKDLYEIAQFTTAKSSNVNQILVRVMDYKGVSGTASSQLVLAMEANRENAKNMKDIPKGGSAIAFEQELKTRFHLTYTPGWQQRYPL